MKGLKTNHSDQFASKQVAEFWIKTRKRAPEGMILTPWYCANCDMWHVGQKSNEIKALENEIERISAILQQTRNKLQRYENKFIVNKFKIDRINELAKTDKLKYQQILLITNEI